MIKNTGNYRYAPKDMDGMTVTVRQIQPVITYPKSSTCTEGRTYRHTQRDSDKSAQLRTTTHPNKVTTTKNNYPSKP